MPDMSHLDKKYFIDKKVYNCPFCNRNNVQYYLVSVHVFDWSNEKQCYCYYIRCTSCNSTSMHLSFHKIHSMTQQSFGGSSSPFFTTDDIDQNIFYSVPTSFFTLDDRIPRLLRELIQEAEGCLKMNYLTGASACMRKSIYELLMEQGLREGYYEDRIKSLKDKFPSIMEDYFDILGHIQQMTSDKVHEQSWDKWDSNNLKLIIETLKTILHEIYVIPEKRKERSNVIKQLREKVLKKNTGEPNENPASKTN